MKKILLADDDSVTRSMLSRAFISLRDGIEVFNAKDGQQATRIIEQNRIDVVITDLQLPIIDGFELLSYLKKNYPNTPSIALTAFGTPEVRAQIESMADVEYYEKPLNLSEIANSVLKMIDSDDRGKINAVSLPSFLQLVEQERKTCALAVRSGFKQGRFQFQRGRMTTAQAADLTGEAAAREMISWTGATIALDKMDRVADQEINSSLKSLLRDGLRQRVEQNKLSLPGNRVFKGFRVPKGGGAKNGSPSLRPRPADTNGRATSGSKAPKVAVTSTAAAQSVKPARKEPRPVAAPEPAPTQTNRPPVQGDRSATPPQIQLAAMLKANEGVIGFEIYDKSDMLTERHPADRAPFRRPPFSYWEYAATLNFGTMKYLAFHTGENIRYYLFKYGELKIIVAMRLGFQGGDFIRRLSR